VHRADAAGAQSRQSPPHLAHHLYHQPRHRHRADRRDRESRHRPAHVPAVDLRKDRDGHLHRDRRCGDAVQLSGVSLRDRGRGHLRVARDHADLELSLHLARQAHHRRAGDKRMKTRRAPPRRARFRVGHLFRGAKHHMKNIYLIAVVLAQLKLGPTYMFALAVPAQAPPKQAVVETSAGTFIIDVTPESAPNQTAHFMKLAADGGYDGTTFHRVVKYGMVQGGDPLTRDPARRAQYGTGGLNAVKAEARAPKMTRGSVAAVLVPGRPDSAGAQFFIVVVDQPGLDGQYTVFGHVSDGMEVVQKISETPVDDKGVATARLEIARVTIRDLPPPTPEPFSTETVQELSALRAVLET